MIEFADITMVIEMIPRLIALDQHMRSELDYQLRLRGILSSGVYDWEKEESEHRQKVMEEIRDSFSMRECEWILTHKDDVRDIMHPHNESKRKKRRAKDQ